MRTIYGKQCQECFWLRSCQSPDAEYSPIVVGECTKFMPIHKTVKWHSIPLHMGEMELA